MQMGMLFSDGNFSKFSATSYILSMKKGVKSASEDKEEGAEGLR